MFDNGNILLPFIVYFLDNFKQAIYYLEIVNNYINDSINIRTIY